MTLQKNTKIALLAIMAVVAVSIPSVYAVAQTSIQDYCDPEPTATVNAKYWICHDLHPRITSLENLTIVNGTDGVDGQDGAVGPQGPTGAIDQLQIDDIYAEIAIIDQKINPVYNTWVDEYQSLPNCDQFFNTPILGACEEVRSLWISQYQQDAFTNEIATILEIEQGLGYSARVDQMQLEIDASGSNIISDTAYWIHASYQLESGDNNHNTNCAFDETVIQSGYTVDGSGPLMSGLSVLGSWVSSTTPDVYATKMFFDGTPAPGLSLIHHHVLCAKLTP